MATILHSKRLRIREFEIFDAEFLLKLVNGASFIRFIGNKNMHSLDEATEYIINQYQKSYTDNGFGFWLIELAETGMAIGGCGIMRRPNLSDPDIGYALLSEFTGQGFAFEAASAVYQFGKSHLQLPKICAIVDEQNKDSRKLLEKLGLQFKEDIILDGDLKRLMYYTEKE